MTLVRCLLGSRVTFTALVLSLVALLGYAIIATALYGNDPATRVDATDTMKGAYALNPDDERQLVGDADEVFVGKVKEQVATKELEPSDPKDYSPGVPVTQYAVEVQERVKGDLRIGSVVTVSQTGGFDKQAKKDMFVEGDERLKPGREYMFSLNRDPDRNWYVVSAPPFGDVPIANDGQRKGLLEKFEKAKKISEATTIARNSPVPAEWINDGALDAEEPPSLQEAPTQ